MENEPSRSREARQAAEAALVRVVHHYGSRPEFVVLGGLVPELLCSASNFRHAGTTDIDVQVDLEIACGSVNTFKLETALQNAEFVPTNERVWQWVSKDPGIPTAIVKFELLADLSDHASGETFTFDGCEKLGAVNLRGTGYATRDIDVRSLNARIGGVNYSVEINVTGLAGFLLAKTAAARSRRKPKDWYDIAFVLLHNDIGDVKQVCKRVREIFVDELPAVRSSLDELAANFNKVGDQGPGAYAEQMRLDHPELDSRQLRADSVIAVTSFCTTLII